MSFCCSIHVYLLKVLIMDKIKTTHKVLDYNGDSFKEFNLND
ncbi:MAG: hypothetical protein Rpha_0920 [Candidatus Ruthia sp. Apha_13_S6]|nr:hypothetical protein [Candidatus Ruthia sp. Apha_13_S6]